jgi:4-carboxymuconolactone decarboxylase
MNQPRFPKLSPEQYSSEQREVAAEITAGPRGEVRGPFIALIHNAGLARRMQQLGEHLRWGSKLPPRTIEFAVLMTARTWNCQHEWYMHEKLARKANLEDPIIKALAEGRKPDGLSPEDAAVYEFCKDAHDSGRVGDAPFEAVKAKFGLEGALDLLALSGYYTLMAMVLNTAGMPLPDNAQPPLKAL